MKKTKIGILGCGNISGIYMKNLTSMFLNVEVIAVCDIIVERAQAHADTYNIPNVYASNKEMLGNKDIEIVVNLTTPDQHYITSKEVLMAGKSVHCEKPMALSVEDGEELLNLAKEKNLLIGNAPDTFLGAGIQTCRKLIDDGFIGTPISATAYLMCAGHESWHPDPEFYYQAGGGPMLDMGPYYVTALVSLLGSVKRLCGMTKQSFPYRTITSEKKFGKQVPVEVETFVSGLMEFDNGVIANIITTFDVQASGLKWLEIHGTEGSIQVPDPNCFEGPVMLSRKGHDDFMEIPLTHAYAENSRGLAVSDMASALQNGRKNRANGDLSFHVLDIMLGFEKSSKSGKFYRPKSKVKRPAAMKNNLINGDID